jgi:hypothetical protein
MRRLGYPFSSYSTYGNGGGITENMRPNARQKTEEYLLYPEELDEISGRLAAHHSFRAALNLEIDLQLKALRQSRPRPIAERFKEHFLKSRH